MNVCKECKYAEYQALKGPDNDPRTYVCLHEDCIDPITGVNIACLDARNIPFYCGKEGNLYEAKAEQAKIVT